MFTYGVNIYVSMSEIDNIWFSFQLSSSYIYQLKNVYYEKYNNCIRFNN